MRWLLAGVLFLVPQSEAVRVTGIKASCRHGQTFVTWKDAAEGEAGARFRYSLYRSDRPITPETLGRAELCVPGILHNSAKLFGYAFSLKDRVDPSKPTCVLEEGGPPLAPWTGLAVRTVRADGKSYYAVVATGVDGKPLSRIEPGESATLEAVEEKVAPLQPIKLGDSKARGKYAQSACITGRKNLPLMLSLHGSQARGGDAGDHGDLYLYFGTPEMGWRDGLPGLFTVRESHGKDGPLIFFARDCIESPSGDRPIETCWFGYFCVPHGAAHAEPRAYAYTERRLAWMVDWVIRRYEADPNRVYSSGQSMGAMGSTQWAFRRPDRFAAIYARLGRVRQSWLPAVLPGTTSINKGRTAKPTPMEDGATDYFERQDSVKWVSEHPEDLPFYAWCFGRQDWVEPWKFQIEMVKALTAQKHGFALAWNNGGHDSVGGAAMERLMKHYGPGKFARNQSYPAFGNSSIDNVMGNGDKDHGDLEGGINLGFVWSVAADEPDRWEVLLSNDLATADMTVDVTPRRCQRFKPKPGERFAWKNSAGGSGEATADAHGRVTVEKVKIKPGETSTLTLSR
jgi:hypothetical protein